MDWIENVTDIGLQDPIWIKTGLNRNAERIEKNVVKWRKAECGRRKPECGDRLQLSIVTCCGLSTSPHWPNHPLPPLQGITRSSRTPKDPKESLRIPKESIGNWNQILVSGSSPDSAPSPLHSTQLSHPLRHPTTRFQSALVGTGKVGATPPSPPSFRPDETQHRSISNPAGWYQIRQGPTGATFIRIPKDPEKIPEEVQRFVN